MAVPNQAILDELILEERISSMLDEMRTYGFKDQYDLDDLFGGYPTSGFKKGTSEVIEDHRYGIYGTHMNSVLYISLWQWHFHLDYDTTKFITAVIQKHGWSRDAWVRIQQYYMACVWPEEHAKKYGKLPVNLQEFELAAFVADNVEQVLEQEY